MIARPARTFKYVRKDQTVKGDYQNQLTWREMKDKFEELAAHVISGNRQDQIVAAIDALDEIDDIRELAELLVVNDGVARR